MAAVVPRARLSASDLPPQVTYVTVLCKAYQLSPGWSAAAWAWAGEALGALETKGGLPGQTLLVSLVLNLGKRGREGID